MFFSRLAKDLGGTKNSLYLLHDDMRAKNRPIVDLVRGNVNEHGIVFPKTFSARRSTRPRRRLPAVSTGFIRTTIGKKGNREILRRGGRGGRAGPHRRSNCSYAGNQRLLLVLLQTLSPNLETKSFARHRLIRSSTTLRDFAMSNSQPTACSNPATGRSIWNTSRVRSPNERAP